MAGDMTFDPTVRRMVFDGEEPESLPFAFSQAIL
jgi:hypothetical protein